MVIHVWCYACGKQWSREIEYETTLEVCAFDFCGCCKQQFLVEFEGQFLKRLTPKRTIRLEEDGA